MRDDGQEREALARIEERSNPGKTGNPAAHISEINSIAQAALAARGQPREEIPGNYPETRKLAEMMQAAREEAHVERMAPLVEALADAHEQLAEISETFVLNEAPGVEGNHLRAIARAALAVREESQPKHRAVRMEAFDYKCACGVSWTKRDDFELHLRNIAREDTERPDERADLYLQALAGEEEMLKRAERAEGTLRLILGSHPSAVHEIARNHLAAVAAEDSERAEAEQADAAEDATLRLTDVGRAVLEHHRSQG